ncbi:MAG: hypothetical protein H6654_17340 [Ardenticatenaceae bacterium]|nr:hypothetical protein [Ardenticatenaceae bacterium]MCB8975328.1 hypothetical protein [Ardenticatenaceae bacterium]
MGILFVTCLLLTQAHLFVEAFWQMSKVIEVRYDKFLALESDRANPLAGL